MTATSTANRARMASRSAQRLGLTMTQCAGLITLSSADGEVVAKGPLADVEHYLTAHAQHGTPGPVPARTPAAWREPIDSYALHLTAAGQSPRTVAARRQALARLGRELRCPPAEVTADQLVGWFGRQAHWKPETRRTCRSAVKGFFSWAYGAGRVPNDLGDALPSVRIPPTVPRPVTDADYAAALAATGPRERLMLRLAAEAGLRRAEVAAVRVSHVEDGYGGAQLRVRGKGGRLRVVPITDDLAETIRRGAAAHTPELAAFGQVDYLFPGDIDGHLSPHHVGKLVAAALPPGWSMHKLRHRFATRVFRGSRNLIATQRLLGHSSVATTQKYVGVDDDEIRAAASWATV